MGYDWSGARARRIAYFKRAIYVLVGAGAPIALLTWLQFYS